MNTSFFGSYSVTEFTDLYHANVRSWHKHFYGCAIHIDQKEVSYFRDKIDNIPQIPNTYLLGYLFDEYDRFEMENNVFRLNEYERIRRKDKYLSVELKDMWLTFSTSQDSLIYLDENGSITTTLINGYESLEPYQEFQVDLSKPLWTL